MHGKCPGSHTASIVWSSQHLLNPSALGQAPERTLRVQQHASDAGSDALSDYFCSVPTKLTALQLQIAILCSGACRGGQRGAGLASLTAIRIVASHQQLLHVRKGHCSRGALTLKLEMSYGVVRNTARARQTRACERKVNPSSRLLSCGRYRSAPMFRWP